MSRQQQISVNYCAQCKEINNETVYNCRWLNLSFCRLKCLQQFYDQITSTCDICKQRLHFNRIHLRDDVKNNDLFTFVCDECFDQRVHKAVHCHYCSGVCYKEAGAQELTTTGLIEKYACSTECIKNRFAKSMKMICTACGIQGKCLDAFQDDQRHTICSEPCMEAFERSHAIKFENCDKCSTKFSKSHGRYENVIIEGAKRKAFCSEKCLHSHLRVDSEHVICCICCQRMRFSDSIRRVCDSRYFCSLRCSIVAETGMDLLMRNDERCHLNNLSLKCATSNPELASYDTIEHCVLLDQLLATANDQVSERKHPVTMRVLSGNDTVILNQCEIYDDPERLTNAPKLSEPANITNCSRCQNNIKPTQLLLQWAYLEFCSSLCYEKFMYQGDYKCESCAEDCSGSTGANIDIIDNKIYYFCNENCEKKFFESMKFCEFCRNIIAPDNVYGFCQLSCEQKFERLYKERQMEDDGKRCYQCRSTKTSEITLSVNETDYDFCSFACFFHMKISCGIFPDQCTICQMYFVRNEGSFMLRYNRKINAFCSQSCLAHYMYKYRFLEMCTICRRRKSNFNMLKSIDDDMTIRFNYCSMQCMQMVDQSTQLENVFFK